MSRFKQATTRGLYRKVAVRLWGDDKFRRLSSATPNAQTLWMHLITGQHCTPLPGLWTASEAGMAEALGWPIEGFRERFSEIVKLGMAEADWPARVLWVPNTIFYDFPANPNIVTSWRKHLFSISECSLKDKAIKHLRESLAHREKFLAAFESIFFRPCAGGDGNGLANGMANPKPKPKPNPNIKDTPQPPPEKVSEKSSTERVEEDGPRVTLLTSRTTISDYPEHAPLCDRVVKHYKQTVGTSHLGGGGREAVLALVLDGHTEEELKRASEGYARYCQQQSKPADRRQGAKNFFAKDGNWLEFVGKEEEEKAQTPKTGEVVAKIIEEDRINNRKNITEVFKDPEIRRKMDAALERLRGSARATKESQATDGMSEERSSATNDPGRFL